MRYTPEQHRHHRRQWATRLAAMSDEDYNRGRRAARLPVPGDQAGAWRVGLGLGLAAAGAIVWPLGAAAVYVLVTWRRRHPLAPGALVAAAALGCVLGFCEAGLTAWTAGLIISAHS